MQKLSPEITLRKEFYALEKSYRPYFDVLTEKQNIYTEYKGAVTITGYLNYNPDILLLSYNPAHGLYRDYDKDLGHLVYTGERPFELFRWGVARENGHWYETQKDGRNHHSFSANCIEFLYEYQAQMTGHSEYGTQKMPSWYRANGGFEKKIMALNLYPFGTDHCATLIDLFKRMKENHALPELEQLKDEWEIRRGFIYKMHKFIDIYVKPKSILCLGKETMSDYSWGQYYEKDNGIYLSDKYPGIVGVSRKGYWGNRAKEAAKLVANIVKEQEMSSLVNPLEVQ